VALSHLDENLDPAYHLAIARRGAYLEFDTFGSECAFAEDDLREPCDEERIAALLRLLDAGYERQMLLSQDVCTKMHWTRMGGRGYAHLLRIVVPALRARGVPESSLTTMLVANPARLLSGEDAAAAATASA
jgi:phosphotriesterase-related protein